MAQARSLNGQRLVAQYWLRQAVRHAPSAEARAAALGDLRYVRGETALKLRLEAGVQPSDHVNGGARESMVRLGGLSLPLPAQLVAQEGLAFSLGAKGEWRLASDPGGETALRFAARCGHRDLGREPALSPSRHRPRPA